MRISDWSSDVCSSDLFHRHAARQRMSMPAIRAKAEIARLHSLRAAGGNCLLTEGQMTRAFHHILQEQVEGTLLRLAQPELAAIKIKALGLSNIVIGRKRSHISLAGCSRHANLILRFGENSNDRVPFIVRSEEHTSE